MDSAEESGCGGDKVIKDDDDSLIERCWEEQYRGDSRKWLIRDGSYRKAREPFCSTTQATYNFPVDEKDESSRKGMFILAFSCTYWRLIKTFISHSIYRYTV